MFKKNRQSARPKKYVSEEKRHAIKSMIACLIIGGIFITFASAVFFGYCRPFTKFEEYTCIIYNREWFAIENDYNHVRVIYYVDGIKYEAKLRRNHRRGGMTQITFYYNVEDPSDTMSGYRFLFLRAMPIIAGIGGLFIIFGFGSFLKWKRKDNREFLKWKQERDKNQKQ